MTEPLFIALRGLTFRSMRSFHRSLERFLAEAHLATIIPLPVTPPQTQLAVIYSGCLPHDLEDGSGAPAPPAWKLEAFLNTDGLTDAAYPNLDPQRPTVVCGLLGSPQGKEISLPDCLSHPQLQIKNRGTLLEIEGPSDLLFQTQQQLAALEEVETAAVGEQREALGLNGEYFAPLVVMLKPGLAFAGAATCWPRRPAHPLDYPVLAVDRRLIRAGSSLKQEYSVCEIRLLLGSLMAV